MGRIRTAIGGKNDVLQLKGTDSQAGRIERSRGVDTVAQPLIRKSRCQLNVQFAPQVYRSRGITEEEGILGQGSFGQSFNNHGLAGLGGAALGIGKGVPNGGGIARSDEARINCPSAGIDHSRTGPGSTRGRHARQANDALVRTKSFGRHFEVDVGRIIYRNRQVFARATRTGANGVGEAIVSNWQCIDSDAAIVKHQGGIPRSTRRSSYDFYGVPLTSTVGVLKGQERNPHGGIYLDDGLVGLFSAGAFDDQGHLVASRRKIDVHRVGIVGGRRRTIFKGPAVIRNVATGRHLGRIAHKIGVAKRVGVR